MKTAETSPAVDPAPLSRREFFATAGASAGAFAALGGIAGVAAAPIAQAAVKSRQYFSNYVMLELDGQYAGTLERAEGGEPALTMAPATPDRPRQLASIRYETLTLRLSDMSPAVYAWISSAMQGNNSGRSLAVITTLANLQETYRLTVQDAAISGIELDSLDAASRDPARFSIKVVPASSAHQFGAGGTAPVQARAFKNSPILRSNFRLFIQELEAATTTAVSVDPVGVEAVVTTGAGGRDSTRRFVSLSSPRPLRFQLPLANAAPLYAWMQAALQRQGVLRQGELQLLDRNLTKVVASVSFNQLAVVRVSGPVQSTSGAQLVEVECEAASIAFNPGELLQQ